jgi:hypothetical protein
VITESGTPDTASDYYFSDPASAPQTRRTISTSQSSTGASGSVLLINSGLVPHSGTGGETDGCIWESALATTIRGVMLLAERTCE